MKKSFILAGLLVGLTATAQYEKRVGINTDSPRASLEVKAIYVDGRTQGILFPHISDEEKKKWQPNDTTGLVAGTVIWNTDLKCLDHFDGEKWQCSDGSNPYYPPVNPTTDPTVKADVWDRTHYIGSFSHNGANIDGEIANTGTNALTLQIPYNQATTGKSYEAITVTRTVQDRSGANKTLTLNIPAGTFTAAKGFLTATITVGNGTTDVYKVKQLDANVEETIATFAFSINGNVSNVNLIASGGVLDKNFGKTNYNLIYVPVSVYDINYVPDSGSPYEKKWLNNNLGANYAKVGNNQHTQQATSEDDYNAFGSLFQWQRPADGHELITWNSSNLRESTTSGVSRTLASNWNPNHSDFIISSSTNNYSSWTTATSPTNLWQSGGQNNPCPIGYHVPTAIEWTDYVLNNFAERNTQYWFFYNIPNMLKMISGGVRYAEGGLDAQVYQVYAWSSTGPPDDDRYALGYTVDRYSASSAQRSAKGEGRVIRCIVD